MSEEEIIKQVEEFNSITVMYGQIVFLKSQLVRYQSATRNLLDLYKEEKAKNDRQKWLIKKLDKDGIIPDID